MGKGTIKGVYRARRPRSSKLWKLMDKWWLRFLNVYEDRFQHKYGYLRKEVTKNGDEFLKCGILDFGFARIRCDGCGYEYLLAFSCKRKLCPSCMKKRQLAHGEFLMNEVLEKVSHRHVVLSIPKRLRHCFLYKRELLPKLSKLAYESVFECLKIATDEKDVCGAAVNVIHTWGELLDWHPHIHLLMAWGVFYPNNSYKGVSRIPKDSIQKIFIHKVFKLLLKEDAITPDVVENMKSWPHSGFHTWVGPLISCLEKKRLECLGQYQSRGLISHDRLQFSPGAGEAKGQLLYEEAESEEHSKVTLIGEKFIKRHGGNKRVWDPLSFLADLTCHIPKHGSKTTLYYGYYSNKKRK